MQNRLLCLSVLCSAALFVLFTTQTFEDTTPELLLSQVSAAQAAIIPPSSSTSLSTITTTTTLPSPDGCRWHGTEWRCRTADYDLRVVYPKADDRRTNSGVTEQSEVSPSGHTVQEIHVYVPEPAPRRERSHCHKCRCCSDRKERKKERARKRVAKPLPPKKAAPAPAPAPPPAAKAVKQQKMQKPIGRVVPPPIVYKPIPVPRIHAPPLPEPWSPPENLWLFWGKIVDKWTSAEVIRHAVKLGSIVGGKWRDPHFLYTFESQEFRDLTLTCCNTILFPPLAHGFPIFNAFGRMEHRISRFVSNGNTMIFTGLKAVLFINQIFKYELETRDYSPGPFVAYRPKELPSAVRALHPQLNQEGMHVTVVDKRSLPLGVQMLYTSVNGSPFFILEYCEVNNPVLGEHPIRVIPRDCPKWKKRGQECGCGNIVYLGYDFPDGLNEKWIDALRASLELIKGKYN